MSEENNKEEPKYLSNADCKVLLVAYTDVCRKLGTLIGTIEVMLIMNKIENEAQIRKVLEECRDI